MVFRVLSPRVKRRFPKISDLIDAGLITQSELQIIIDMDLKFPGYSKNWLPLCWAASLLNRARSEGRIPDDLAVMTIISELNKFRASCGVLMVYNQINIPLVYIHVVTIAVYSYFMTDVLGQQMFTPKETTIATVLQLIPLGFIFEFLFYMGWLKVAETMINPFGSDDDDFEVNYMIDRNLQASYLIVDEMHNEHPELLKDQYWNEIPGKLPDKHKEEMKRSGDEKGERTDLFDVVDTAKPSRTSMRRVTIIDPEAGAHASFIRTNRSSSIIRPANMVPRSTIISENYQGKNGVEAKQSRLEREMEKIRLQELFEMIGRGSTETSTSQEGDFNVTKRNLKGDDANSSKNDSLISQQKLGSKKRIRLSNESSKSSTKSKKLKKKNEKQHHNSPATPAASEEESVESGEGEGKSNQGKPS